MKKGNGKSFALLALQLRESNLFWSKQYLKNRFHLKFMIKKFRIIQRKNVILDGKCSKKNQTQANPTTLALE